MPFGPLWFFNLIVSHNVKHCGMKRNFERILKSLLHLLLRAGWAPVAVLIFHAAMAKTSLRTPLDFTIHFLGGASMAYLMYRALESFAFLLGQVTFLGQLIFSFALACTVGVFWEFTEFFRDTMYHTHIQQSLQETMLDLVADAAGATASLLLISLIMLLGNPRRLLSSSE